MSNQYEVLGKAPAAEDLKKLSPSNIHLAIKNMKDWEIEGINQQKYYLEEKEDY